MATIDKAVAGLINKACKEAAKSLGSSLMNIGRINAGSNYPIAERNTVVHLASAFMSHGLDVYAEAKIKGRPKNDRLAHIDLLAYGPIPGHRGKTVAIPIEAKAMGPHHLGRLMRDIRRIRNYEPAASELVGHEDTGKELHFWEKSIRYGLFVLQAHRKQDYIDDWQARVREPKEFFKRIKEETGRRIASGSALAVEEKRWPGCKAVHLLWVAFRLP